MELKDFCEVKDWIAAITRFEAQIQSQTGLTLNHACAICCLGKGLRSAGGLAEELRVSRPSLSRLVKPLFDKGLLEWEPGAQRLKEAKDARHKYLRLTPSGVGVYKNLLELQGSWFPFSPFSQPGKPLPGSRRETVTKSSNPPCQV
ncbi:MAG: winged helix-turn-helix transcriptional regulator [Spirochaetales bacterium]|nr:winged helix-turn-helix transcriptional regulator [Spirochaetales bacterium]